MCRAASRKAVLCLSQIRSGSLDDDAETFSVASADSALKVSSAVQVASDNLAVSCPEEAILNPPLSITCPRARSPNAKRPVSQHARLDKRAEAAVCGTTLVVGGPNTPTRAKDRVEQLVSQQLVHTELDGTEKKRTDIRQQVRRGRARHECSRGLRHVWPPGLGKKGLRGKGAV